MKTLRQLTIISTVLTYVLVTVGGLVRATGSGLGCPDWPTCDESRVVAPLEYHAMIEFVNRTITGLVSVAVMLAVLGSLVRVPRRRDLTWLSLGLVAGVLAQIVLGGLTVLFELSPPFVMGHFLVSMVLIWNAVVLHERASSDVVVGGGSGPTRVLVAAAAVVIVLGTVVTASGPHGGDEDVERLGFAMGAVTRVHAVAVWVFLALTAAVVVGLLRAGAGVVVRRRAELLVLAIVVQGAVGYWQYFTRLPAFLVGVHIAGATLVWIAVLRLDLAAVGISPLWQRRPKPLLS